MKYIFLAPLIPLAIIYRFITACRNFFYNFGLCKIIKIDGLKVLSIGNITVGGTGKTPFVDFLIKKLILKNKKIAVLSRGYKSNNSSFQKVENKKTLAQNLGDEPVLLSLKNQEVDVYVGVNKSIAAQNIAACRKYDFLIADDAFQHRRLARDVDFVLLDALEPCENYFPLPFGRARDSFCELKRANCVIITRTNLAEFTKVEKLERKAKKICKYVFKFDIAIEKISPLDSQEKYDPKLLQNKNILLVSAIGRPESFEDIIRQQIKPNIAKHLIFKDHHSFNLSDIHFILDTAKKLNVDKILITEKDEVKIKDLSRDQKFLTVKIQLKPAHSQEGEFDEFINSILG